MNRKNRQGGATLIEILIGLALSLIVTSSMVALMGNSMGSATRIIQMTQLSDELRNAMSMMTRDVRRSNYSAFAALCYGNSDCGTDAGGTTVTDLTVVGGNCMIFNVDRDQDNFAAAAPGAFRLADDNGFGYLEMWVGDGAVTCGDAQGQNDDDWFALTDPDFVDIRAFNITPIRIDNSIEEGGGTLNVRANTVDLEIIGVLRLDNKVSRRIVDRIRVRNDFIWKS